MYTMRKTILWAVFVLAAFSAHAQLPPACPPGTPPADDCFDACIYCNFNGVTSTTAGYTAGGAGGFCGSIENEQWLGFIAGADQATFTATAINCTNGDGIQIALYEDCAGSPVDCNGGQDGGAGIPVNLFNVPLTPGTNYYLLVDGFGGDQCTFNITVDPPAAVIAPPIGNTIGPIQGPSNVCPGATVTYTIPPVANAGAYTWTVPNGWMINGQTSPQQILAIDGGTSVEITFGPNGGQICVSAANSCYPNGPSICKPITVAPIPPTTLAPAIVCSEDAPYDLPWGDQAPSSGLYQTTLQSYLGCDSVVKQQVTIKAPLVTNLPLKTICAGDAITICGTEYTEGGAFSHMCESFQGCDSLINFSINLLDPVAEINGGGTLTCTTTSITLTAAASPNITLFTWKNGAGQNIGNGSSLVVTAPGTYILSAAMNGGGIQCVKADTIVIAANAAPPSVQATGGSLNCTATSVQLMATSNASPATWLWSGPSGFTANIPNPVATNLGTYTVTVTNGANGCSATSTAVVNGNTTPPDITPLGATLTCAITSAQITANANPTTATYQWSGPNNFSSGIQTPTVSFPGNYVVTVTNTVNNCTATGTAVVLLDNTAPGATAATAGTISCTTPTIQVNAGPGTAGNTFTWSGPNSYSSNQQNADVTLAGTYNVVVRGSNGCTSTASTQVVGNTTLPDAAAIGDTVSCGTQSIVLQGVSTTTGAIFNWSGPSGFTSNLQNPPVTTPGNYTLTVTGTNACTNTAVAIVAGDFGVPDVSATGGSITCTQSSTTISGNSNTSGATLTWSGPGGFTSNLPTVMVNTVGNYVLTATAPNGCTATTTAMVLPDADLPNATADGGTLNCAIDTIILNGGTTSQGVTLAWSGPNSFTSTQEDPFVTVNGVYVLTVTNTTNGCTAQASATVALDDTAPAATAQGDTLTCDLPNLTLSGTTNAANPAWLWSGPGNFSSTAQNPDINVAGTYTLQVTNLDNGCTATASTAVAADQNAPTASSSTGILTCSLDSLTLNGSATLPSNFSWSGPNGFVFSGANPIVVNPGDYNLVATANINGCTDTITITVGQDIAAPDGTTTGNTLDCNNPQVPIGVNSLAGVSYSWSGPGTFDPNAQNPLVDAGGLYTVTITAANGCSSTAEATVLLDTDPPVIVAVANDFVTCFAPSVNIQTNITSVSPVISTAWTGPNNYTSTDEDALVFEGGSYTLVATATNGCTSELSVNVQEDTAIPDVAAVGGTITCTDTTIQLNGSSATLGTLYSWSGPNSFTSTDEDPTVSLDGIYTVVVTSQNGCTASTQATVALDVVLPGAASVSSNNLDCDDLTATLTGSSTTGNVQYAWSGPNNFSANTATASVDLPGDYQVAVTGPNGCISTSTVTVTQDITDPDADAMGGTVDCISGQLNLTGISATTGSTFAWSGPNNFSAQVQNPTVSNPGLYILTVTGPNGCTALANATVNENTDSPVVTLDGAGTLTCTVTDLSLVSTIETAGATGVWTGPNNFSDVTPNISVSAPGIYTYTVTATNGCISAPSLTILQDIELPQAVQATGGLLNCTFPSIDLGSSSSSEVSYAWTGPGNFSSTEQNPAVTNPGTYTVTFTNLSNGCSATASALVTQDPTVPDIAVQADSLTCATTNVTLNATSNTQGVTFQWSGPNNFNSTLEDPQTSVPGAYQVVATAQSGCTATFNYTVTQNVNLPNVTAAGDTLTCTQQSGLITSGSTTPGATFVWSGPGGFNSTQTSPNVTITGLYTVVVTGPNGCTSSAQATVAPDVNAPVVTATGGTITCFTPGITLAATSNITVTWQWSGPGNFSSSIQNPSVTLPGNYTLAATAPNGCVSTQIAIVLADTQAPNISTGVPEELDCTTTQVGLSASVAGTGSYSYQWGTQNGVILSGANTNAPQVTQAGVYSVQVTNLGNGCSATKDVTVLVDPATPSGAGLAKKNISCYGETDGSVKIDSIQGGTPPFSYSIDNQAFTPSTVFTSLTPGTHTLLIQDANGCEYETSFVIEEPEEFLVDLGPDTTIHLGATVLLTLDNLVTDPDRVKQTKITPATLIFPDTLTPTYSFRYQVEVIDSNGCRAKDERFIIVDRERWVYIPNVFNPNSDDNNLVMVFGGEDVERVELFQVYDRWGTALHEFRGFKPNDPVAGWDGRYKGQELTPAVFVYYAKVLFKDGETEIFKGDVTLVR